MASETATLQRASNGIANEADRLSAAFAKQLTAVLRKTDRALRSWLETQPQQPSPSARNAIRGVLRDAGYDALADAATSEPFNEIAARVAAARRAVELAIDESATAILRLDAWRQWHLADLLTEGSVLTRSLGDAVMRGTGRSRRRLPIDLGDILDASESRIQTLYDTAVSVYGRQVEAEQAGDDPSTAFVYMGPVDAKTRDFCLSHVGKVYTRAEIDELDNGQMSNVFLTGGGWNCRHTFHEISQFGELSETGFAPEIRDAVADINRRAA